MDRPFWCISTPQNFCFLKPIPSKTICIIDFYTDFFFKSYYFFLYLCPLRMQLFVQLEYKWAKRIYLPKSGYRVIFSNHCIKILTDCSCELQSNAAISSWVSAPSCFKQGKGIRWAFSQHEEEPTIWSKPEHATSKF